MKRFFFVFLIFLFLLGGCLSFGAFADDIDGAEDEASKVVSDDPVSTDRDSFSFGLYPSVLEGTPSPVDSVALLSVAPITPSGDGGLKDTLLSLLGSYDPVVLEYSYTSSQGYTSYLREVQLDYPWLASAVIFLLLVYCSFATLSRAIFGRS